MAQHSIVTQNDRQIKKINAFARHKSSEQAKKDKEEIDKNETQMQL
jgi:hypothetical protein